MQNFWTKDQSADSDFQNVKVAKLPTVDELKFLGIGNLLEVQRYHRGEKRKLVKMRRTQTLTVDTYGSASLKDVQTYISLNEISPSKLEEIRAEVIETGKRDSHPVMCNWHGLITDRIAREEQKSHPDGHDMKEFHKKMDEAWQKFGTCHYGKQIAEWCEQAPFPGCKLQCVEHDINGTSPTCERCEDCHSERPFLDKPCVLANGTQEILESCQRFLRQKLVDLIARNKLIDEYLYRVAVALREAEQKPLIPGWRHRDNYALPGAMVIVFGAWSDGNGFRWDVGRVVKTSLVALLDPLLNDSMLIVKLLGRDNELRYFPFNWVSLIELNDVFYLEKNPEYCKVWLRWCRLSDEMLGYFEAAFETLIGEMVEGLCAKDWSALK